MATARAVVVRSGPSTVLGTTTSARKAIVHTSDHDEPQPGGGRQGEMGGASGHVSMLRGGRPRSSRGITSLVRVSRDVPGGDLGTRSEPEPQPDPLEVRLGGPFGDAQAVGQLAVREAVGHEGRDLRLAGGEPVGTVLLAVAGRGSAAPVRPATPHPRWREGASGPRAPRAGRPGSRRRAPCSESNGAARSPLLCSTSVGAWTRARLGSTSRA